MGLTDKQKRFVEEYLVDLNGTQAAIRAGYNPKSAKEQASRMLTNDDIHQAIQINQKKISTQTEISIHKVLTLLSETYELAMAEKDFSAGVKALELLGKHVGMWPKGQHKPLNNVSPPQVIVYLPDNGRGQRLPE